MSIFSWLFGKNKGEEKDGQEEYFKEDFAPVIKRPATKKQEIYNAEPDVKQVDVAPEFERKADKPAKAVLRRSERKVIKPTPKSERIINPSSKAVKTIKPVKKSAEPKSAKAMERPVVIEDNKTSPNGKFEIEKAKDGRFFFTLYASNHNAIAYSQLYSSSSGATNGISSIIANSQKAAIEDTTLKKTTPLPCPKWEIYLDKAGEYRFRLYAPNGQCICHSSHGYSSKSGCKNGMDSIKRFCAEAKVNKSYAK